MLPISRFPFEVALTNAKPHSVYMLVIPDVGILYYTDPGLRNRDVFHHGADGPPVRVCILEITFRVIEYC